MNLFLKNLMLIATLAVVAVFKAGYVPRAVDRCFYAVHFRDVFGAAATIADIREDQSWLTGRGSAQDGIEKELQILERDLSVGLERWKRSGDRLWVAPLTKKADALQEQVNQEVAKLRSRGR